MNGIYKKTPSMYKQLRLYYYITVCLYIFVHISICIILWFASPDDQEWQMLSGGREAFSERPDFFKAMDLFNSCREKDSNQTFFEPFEILNCCLTGRNPAPLGMYKTLWKWDILDIHWLARFLNHQQCSPCFPCFLQSTWNFQLVLRKHPCFNPLHHESEKKQVNHLHLWKIPSPAGLCTLRHRWSQGKEHRRSIRRSQGCKGPT